MERDILLGLLKKYNSNTASLAEKKEIFEWYDSIKGSELSLDDNAVKFIKNDIFQAIQCKLQKSRIAE
ncbi:hypothetical protein [Pedobacter endophyticus]|uniref:Uncharacterized protein n=1 Tax=Pedobacter endophyticus TaxID=2789740 RepID=A0A7S9PY86_9SPHI|nr:hypothetical protein [Pedobacter endophyticus]QPH38943.1 hypothetical protein IZT61_18045 [Pedobacter endophyticus]